MSMFNSLSKIVDKVNSKIDTEIDVQKMMSSELNGVIDYGLWLETIEIQKKFNDSVAPGWLENNKYDYWMAVLDETVEVLGSRHWKWWKNGDKLGVVDWDNIKVELIDLFHFILSLCLKQQNESIIFSQLANMEINKLSDEEIKADTFFEEFWEQFLMAVHMKLLPVVAVRIVEFWYKAGGDLNDLFMEYRIKAALNNIRQEFGYNKENYNKQWLDTDTGELAEDNVIAWKLSNGVPLDENTVKNMTSLLRDYYLTNVII